MPLAKVGILTALVAGLGSFLPSGTPPAAAAPRGLEFGPYLGTYDFDASTWFEDRALVGLRGSVCLSAATRIDVEFDEVYTRRERSGNSARQVSLALHGRLEPLARARLSPSLLAGVAFVGLDDSADPDAFSEAYDVGAGARWRLSERWTLRGEWLLRAQQFQVLEIPRNAIGDGDASAAADGADSSTLWGRALRIGASYAF